MALQPQQRALAILAGVFGGGLLIAFLAISLLSSDDGKTQKISIGPERTSTSTSVTLPPTTVTLPMPTVAPAPALVPVPANGQPTPGTIVVVPTTGAVPPPTTVPTPSTSKPPTVTEELETLLENALLGDAASPDGAPPRVTVTYDKGDLVRITWALDDTLSEGEQRYTAREEAFALLRAVQGYGRLGDERIILRATLPDPDTGDPQRVVRLGFDRDTLDAIDFATLDPLSIFGLADEADIDPALDPTPPPTSSTTSTSSP